MRIALIGRPNCGKSTLFNQVAGYRANTGNMHGTTVACAESRVRVGGEVLDLVDLPGTYTLTGSTPAEAEVHRYLDRHPVDAVINVVDASGLPQGLELTLELLPLGLPVVVALNMLDEAARRGLKLDGPGLGGRLVVPVLPLVASKGRGVRNLFLVARDTAIQRRIPQVGTREVSSARERHALAEGLAAEYSQQGERYLTLRDRLDDILLHPVLGYLALVAVLLTFFQLVYGLGRLVEPPLLALFLSLAERVGSLFVDGSLPQVLVLGLLQGIAAGVAIVLPYLVPFLLGLALMEDLGYLPRVAFLMDSLMHRIGLHGKAVVPFILGYGCNVPAVMATRTLEEPRDRYLAAALATLVPCAARISVVFGLVAFYMGPLAAMALYLFNLLVIALTGRVLSNLMPEDTPGLILEMPPYRAPTLRAVANKAWFRTREFAVEAMPALIVGSAVLALLEFFRLANFFDALVRPLTWLLGLPAAAGVPLIFGVLRKELSLIMLGQALGTTNFGSVLTSVQMFVYSVFVVFYIPCIATLSALKRELGTRAMLVIAGTTILIATVAAFAARLLLTALS
jgi:ferrous iron transport protein B